MDQMKQLKAEVKLLIMRGKLQPISDLEHLSEETLNDLILECKQAKLKSINETVCNSIVKGVLVLCKNSKVMSDDALDLIHDDLLGDERFVSHATDFIGKITAYIPYVSVVVGVVIMGKHIYNGVKETKKVVEDQTQNPQEV